MQKLIGIDLDGTLLCDNKTITDFTKQTLSEATKYNHLVVLATGRSFFGSKPYYDQLKLKTPLISFNGALITLPDGTDIKQVIPKKLVNSLYNDLNELFVTAFFNSKERIISVNHNKDLEYLFNGAISKDTSEFDIVTAHNHDILNIVVSIEEKDQMTFENYFKDLPVMHRYWGSHEGLRFYDIHLIGVSKATALKDILGLYNLNKDQLITFGDGPNDFEMLEITKDGIAMNNAPIELKAVAKYETDFDNNNDGVAKYLVKYYL